MLSAEGGNLGLLILDPDRDVYIIETVNGDRLEYGYAGFARRLAQFSDDNERLKHI